jgi:spore coat polysaccharide biosynthesis predicted glycosyltransferase SpsG
MRHVYRADASDKIGAGHVMRISAIAEESILRGIESIFIGRIDNLQWVEERIKNIGFSSFTKNPDTFECNESDILIIDSYKLSDQDKLLIQQNWSKVVNIFDEYTPVYQSDLKIHPGIRESWESDSKAKILAGLKYIPIRKSITTNIKKFESKPLEILISGGGSDANGFTSAVVEFISSIDHPFHANVLTHNLKENIDKRFTQITLGSIFDGIISKVDLVFTLAGTSAFEFLAAGLPIAVGCSVENQKSNYDHLSDKKMALPIGFFDKSVWQFDYDSITKIIKSPKIRTSYRSNSIGTIDLSGAKRIVDVICGL